MSDLKQTHNFWPYSFVRVGLEWSLNQDGGGWYHLIQNFIREKIMCAHNQADSVMQGGSSTT